MMDLRGWSGLAALANASGSLQDWFAKALPLVRVDMCIVFALPLLQGLLLEFGSHGPIFFVALLVVVWRVSPFWHCLDGGWLEGRLAKCVADGEVAFPAAHLDLHRAVRGDKPTKVDLLMAAEGNFGTGDFEAENHETRASANDPKLSDCGATARCLHGGGKAEAEAGSVTARSSSLQRMVRPFVPRRLVVGWIGCLIGSALVGRLSTRPLVSKLDELGLGEGALGQRVEDKVISRWQPSTCGENPVSVMTLVGDRPPGWVFPTASELLDKSALQKDGFDLGAGAKSDEFIGALFKRRHG